MGIEPMSELFSTNRTFTRWRLWLIYRGPSTINYRNFIKKEVNTLKTTRFGLGNNS